MDVETLKKFDIPKQLIADLADVWPQDVSAYLRHGKITPRKADRIREAIADVLLMLTTFEIRPDLSDASSVRELINRAKQQQMFAEQSSIK